MITISIIIPAVVIGAALFMVLAYYGHPGEVVLPSGIGITLPIITVGSWAPANATTYYFGADAISTTPTSYNMAYVKCPITGILKGAFFKVRITTAGSAELVSHFVRINDAIDVGLPQAAYNATFVDVFSNTLNQVVNAGDMLAIKVVTPTWSSAPLTIRPEGYLYIE